MTLMFCRYRKRMGGVLLLCITIGAGCSGDRPDDAGPAQDTVISRELLRSEVATAAPVRLERLLSISGSLAPLNATTVRAKVPGEILEVAFREGQAVSAGDVLVRLDTRTLAAQLKSADATLEKARADLAIARLNFENSKRLFEKGVLSKTDFDTRSSLFDAAEATVKLGEAQRTMASIALDDAVVRAPFDGIVARRLVDPGGKASPDTALIELVDLIHMEFRASAPAVEMAEVAVGQHARVRVDGYADETFDARLERISPVAERGSRLVLLYLSMDNPEGRLRGGMFAQASLVLEHTEPVLAIPRAALRQAGDKQVVLALSDGVLEEREVTLGLVSESQDLVEVRNGLAEGDRVLAVRFSALEPGTAVTVIDD